MLVITVGRKSTCLLEQTAQIWSEGTQPAYFRSAVYSCGTYMSAFLRNEQPSVSFAFPPVERAKTVEQPLHVTLLVAWL